MKKVQVNTVRDGYVKKLPGDATEYFDGSGNWTKPGMAGVDTLNFVIDGGGAVIATGVVGDIGPYDFDLTFAVGSLLADQSGSIAIAFWADTFPGNYPPTIADVISASAPLTISSDDHSQDTTLTGWTTLLPKGKSVRVNVNSCTSIKRVGVALKYTR